MPVRNVHVIQHQPVISTSVSTQAVYTSVAGATQFGKGRTPSHASTRVAQPSSMFQDTPTRAILGEYHDRGAERATWQLALKMPSSCRRTWTRSGRCASIGVRLIS